MGKATHHHQFKTAVVTLKSGLKVDVTTARLVSRSFSSYRLYISSLFDFLPFLLLFYYPSLSPITFQISKTNLLILMLGVLSTTSVTAHGRNVKSEDGPLSVSPLVLLILEANRYLSHLFLLSLFSVLEIRIKTN